MPKVRSFYFLILTGLKTQIHEIYFFLHGKENRIKYKRKEKEILKGKSGVYWSRGRFIRSVNYSVIRWLLFRPLRPRLYSQTLYANTACWSQKHESFSSVGVEPPCRAAPWTDGRLHASSCTKSLRVNLRVGRIFSFMSFIFIFPFSFLFKLVLVEMSSRRRVRIEDFGETKKGLLMS